MKKLQSNFTTLEQSKRLLELGVPAWTADCYYYDVFDKHPKVSYIDADRDYKWNLETEYAPKPCWSVGRLREIFYYSADDKEHVKEVLHELPNCSIETLINIITVFVKQYNELDFSK